MTEKYKHVYSTKQLVRWSDMDEFGHVNNSRYLTYFEQARIDWCVTMKLANLGRPIGPIMVYADVTYLKPIVFPAEMEIKLFVGEPGNSSFMTNHEIFVDDVMYAHGKVKLVWFDYEQGKSVRFPEEIRRLFD